MRDDADRVGLADGGDFHHLGDAAHVRQRGANEVHVVVLHERVEIPLESPLFAVGQRHRRHLPELGKVLQRVLVADRVFDEEGVVRFDSLAGTQRVVQLEALVKVDAPVAVRAHALAHVLAFLFHPAHHRARVVDAADRNIARRHTECAIPGFHRGTGALLEAQPGARRRPCRRGAPSRIALAVVARRSAEQFVHRNAEGFSLDVPQREVQRPERVRFLPPRRIEPRDVRFLPDRLGAERALTDQRSRALLQRVFGATLADAGNADIGLDRHDHGALVEQRIQVRRSINPHPRDFGLRQFGHRLPGPQPANSRRRCDGVEKGSSVHRVLLRSYFNARE